MRRLKPPKQAAAPSNHLNVPCCLRKSPDPSLPVGRRVGLKGSPSPIRFFLDGSLSVIPPFSSLPDSKFSQVS